MVVELAEVASLFAIFLHKGFGLWMGTVTKSFVLFADKFLVVVLACWFGSGVLHI